MKYFIKLVFDTDEKKYTSEVNLYTKNKKDVYEFIVHKNTRVKSILMNGKVVKWQLKNINLGFIPEGRKLIIQSNNNIQEEINFKFIIEGNIDIIKYEINQISNCFIELNIYSPWYPTSLDFPLFDSKIEIVGLADYYVVKGERKKDTWEINYDNTNDNYIIAYKDPKIKQIKSQIGIIKLIANRNFYEINFIEEKMKKIIEYYNNIFTNSIKEDLDIVIAKRKEGGGYCRKNLIVMEEDMPDKVGCEMTLAHEYSHLWFEGADVNSWEDWLNESFAEYLSMIYIEEQYGTKYYNDIINKLFDYTKDCPPILDSDRNSELGSRIRYKGTILLHKIRKLYGMNTVKEMFNILVNMEQKKTSSFIEEVGQANSEVAEFLNNEIRK